MAQPDLFEQCPPCPDNQVVFEFNFRRILITFNFAEHGGRHFCSTSVQCPLQGYAHAFPGQPGHESILKAFQPAYQEALAFIREHGKEAVAAFEKWMPDLPGK
jgi:hypothetical protein